MEKHSHFKYSLIYIKFNDLIKRALGGSAWQGASSLGCDTIPKRSPGGMQPPSPAQVMHTCVCVSACSHPCAGRDDAAGGAALSPKLWLVSPAPPAPHSVPSHGSATPVPPCTLSSCDASPRNPHLAPEQAGVSLGIAQNNQVCPK